MNIIHTSKTREYLPIKCFVSTRTNLKKKNIPLITSVLLLQKGGSCGNIIYIYTYVYITIISGS